MRKTFILILLVFGCFVAHAQHKRSDTLRLNLIKASTDTARYLAMKELGNFYYTSLPDSAIIFDQQAYLIAKKNNWLVGQAHQLNNIASDYDQLGDYANSILYYQKSMILGQQTGDDFQVANANSNIGAAYLSKKDFQKALPYFVLAKKLLQDFAKTNKKRPKEYNSLIAINLSNLGEAYSYLGKLDSAKYYLTESYKKCLAAHYKIVIGNIKNDLGRIEELGGNNDKALQYFREAIAADEEINNLQDLSASNLNIAKLYFKLQQPDSAISHAQTALNQASKGNFKPEVLNASQELYNYYNKVNNLPLAFKYFKLSTAMKDSLFSQDKVKQLLNLDFNEKMRQQELQAEQARAQNRLRIYILCGGLGVVLLLAIIFWRNSNQRKKANRLLQEQKEEIQTTLAELKTTQAQLVQSAKMASLGELTAGIAHEIQNPLNFVNNFSEVSAELVDEMDEELNKGDIAEARAISADIKQNLEKIRHHGKRADFIVK
ncbi:MAG: tetratricopeptide repeat protein, partial [Bacteroidetes bacterium]|nr:tetratricopeptide repeat protein [Bacteroidota bacterium]